MTTVKDIGSIILLVLLSPLALIALLLGSLFAIPIYIIGVIVAFARQDVLLGWNTRIKVALRWPLEFWLKLKTKEAFAFLGRLVGRLSGRLKKWNAGRIRRTDGRRSYLQIHQLAKGRSLCGNKPGVGKEWEIPVAVT